VTNAPPPEKVLVLRTCDAERKSAHEYVSGGFQWPESGPVEAPDWSDRATCGKGLHGWLWGEGNGNLGNLSEDALWLVLEVEASTIVDLNGNVKFPRASVVFCGPRVDAVAYLADRAPAGKAIIGHTVSAGDYGTATAGDYGTATAGNGGTATAGDGGTATAGDGGTATAGYGGTATAGTRGTATAGYGGTATAGNGGTATAGTRGTATAGYGGTISIEMWDEALKAWRKRCREVGGEDGLKPDTPYRLVDGKFTEVAP